ncbi:MAG: type II toxin-antitoxin system HicB family antitoxin [Janthinobacterium lividum]
MDGYEVKVYYSSQDECYIAQIVEFVGCAVDGPTPEIALARLHEAKADWMQIVQEKGQPLPAPRYGQRKTENLATL